MNNIPWTEKYRPKQFDNIVLDPMNRTIFKNAIDKNIFPNFLFYGPPGSGKTSTIINLIDEYQRRYDVKNSLVNRGNIIHLNASDDRGIDIVRNQIFQFVSSKNMFDDGLKFVVLDEVDYMTKNAQQALKYLLQISGPNIRYCLICNYISKIDESLKNEFICIRFNQLPPNEIITFIKHITVEEGIEMDDATIEKIQGQYCSDIRSMINFIQSNSYSYMNIIHKEVWEHLYGVLQNKTLPLSDKKQMVNVISSQYNMNIIQIIIHFCNYVIRFQFIHYTTEQMNHFLSMIEMLLHNSEDIPSTLLTDFFVQKAIA